MMAKTSKQKGPRKSGALFPADYRKSEGVYIQKRGLDKKFTYNDGDVSENYLLDVIKGAKDRSLFSNELVESIRDWNSLYHLSPKRANLLRPFSELLRGRVLEVGAGCGAVTRFLGELGSNVVGIEGSYRRALIARERTRGLKNIEIVSERIQDFSSPKLFDVAVAIGVLEYSRVYIKGTATSEEIFLTQISKLLKPNGTIILAIENKLGLKYLAGAAEDHFGTPFFGVNDSYSSDSVVTFGHAELQELFNRTGFKEQRWYVPCPDYKLPTTILSPKLMLGQPELAATLLAQSTILDPQRPNDPSFSLEQAWSVIEQNHLLQHLANSFLVVAGRTSESCAKIDSDKSLAWHYSVDRHPAFTKQAQFVKDGNRITVERHRLQPGPAPAVPLECTIRSEPFVAGKNWWLELSSIVNKPNWSAQDVADWARVWIEALVKECKLDNFDGNTFKEQISGRFLDATPFNLIRTPADVSHFIDQEWTLRPDIEVGYLVYRGLWDSLSRLTSCAPSVQDTPIKINFLIMTVFAQLGVLVSKSEIERFYRFEKQIQDWVHGRPLEGPTDEWVAGSWGVSMRPRAPLDREILIRNVDLAKAELENVTSKLDEVRAATEVRERDHEQTLTSIHSQQTVALEEAKTAAARGNAQAALLKAELEIANEALRERELAAAQIKSDLEAAQSLAAGRDLDTNKLSSELDQARATADERGRNHEQARTSIQSQAAAFDEAKAAVVYSDAQVALLRTDLEIARAAILKHELAAERIEKDLEAARSLAANRGHEIIKLSSELDQTRAAAEERKRDYEQKTADREANITRLSSELRSEQALRQQHDGEISRLVHDLDAARLFLRDTQTEVQRLSGELDEREQIISRSDTERRRVEQEIARMSGALNVARDQLGTARSELALGNIALDETRQQAKLSEARAQKLLSELQSAKAQLSQAESQVANLRRDLDETYSRLVELAAIKNALEDAHSKNGLNERRISELSNELQSIRSESAKIEGQLVRQNAELAETQSGLNASRSKAASFERNLIVARSLLDELRGTIEQQARAMELESYSRRRDQSSIWRMVATRLWSSSNADHGPHQWEYDLIRKSKLFDAVWYLQRNPDVATAGQDPLWHYILHGAAEGREPQRLFDTAWYRSQSSDINDSKMTPLAHYASVGVSKGLDPHPLFDTNGYLQHNPEVAAAHINPLYHFIKMGAANGLNPNPLFDSLWYLEKNPDVAAARENPLYHYITFGAAEGRDPHPLFNTNWYVKQYPDVAESRMNPLVHYLKKGASEGRNPNPLFDAAGYMQRYPDVADAGDNPLVHYIIEGFAEGRDPHPLFNSDWYLKKYSKIIRNGMNPLTHYLWHGGFEGCNPNPMFDSEWYLTQHKEAVMAHINPLVHYLSLTAAKSET